MVGAYLEHGFRALSGLPLAIIIDMNHPIAYSPQQLAPSRIICLAAAGPVEPAPKPRTLDRT